MAKKKEITYCLKHFDTDVLTFKMHQNQDVFDIEVLALIEKDLLPLTVSYEKHSVKNWLLDRLMNENKCNLDALLRHLETDFTDKKRLVELLKCLSLRDPYWVKSSQDKGSFTDYNFYDNPLIKKLSNISFDADDYYYVKAKNCSPELTTNSSLRTCWIKQKGEIYLIKTARNKDIDDLIAMHTEVLAAEIANVLAIDVAESTMYRYRGRISCKQKLFLSKEIGYISADKLIHKADIEAVFQFCESLGEDILNGLRDMLLLDVILCNNNRKLSDFGFLIDNRTNSIIDFAPLFQNGYSLFFDAAVYDIQHYKEYEKENKPYLYSSHLDIYHRYLQASSMEKIKKLENFTFNRKHPHLLWDERLSLLEEYLANRIQELQA